MNENDRRRLHDACVTVQDVVDRRFPHAPHIKEPVRVLLRRITGLVTGDIYRGEVVPGAARSYDRIDWTCAAAGAEIDQAFTLIAEHKARKADRARSHCRARETALMYDTPASCGIDHFDPKSSAIPCPVHGVPAGVPCSPKGS